MKIYMNTGVGRPCYFIPIKPMHRSSRIEAHGKTGIGITYWNGDWKVEEASYYNKSINEFPVVGEIDLKTACREDAESIRHIQDTYLGMIEEWRKEE